MRWKKARSNIIVTIILSIAYVIVTLLNIIGPLHMDSTGGINPLGALSLVSLLYLGFALAFTWLLYFSLRQKAELLFFLLIISGIVLIVFENFLWGWMGS
jgi:hypothetical protein